MTRILNLGRLIMTQGVSISPPLSLCFHAFVPHLIELCSLFVAHTFASLSVFSYSERSVEGEAEQGQRDFGLAGSRETQRGDSGV